MNGDSSLKGITVPKWVSSAHGLCFGCWQIGPTAWTSEEGWEGWGSFKLETRQDKGYPKFIQLKGFLFSFFFEGHFWATLALSYLQAFPENIGTQGCSKVKDLAAGCIIRPLNLRPFPPILCQCSLHLQGSLEGRNPHAHSWATRSRVSK